jgi:hypothetical protein
MKMVTLWTGKTVPEPVVATTLVALRAVAERDIIILCDLLGLCKNGGKIFWGCARETLLDLALIQPGDRVDDDVRDIVVAAVKFNGISSVTITDPVADSE